MTTREEVVKKRSVKEVNDHRLHHHLHPVLHPHTHPDRLHVHIVLTVLTRVQKSGSEGGVGRNQETAGIDVIIVGEVLIDEKEMMIGADSKTGEEVAAGQETDQKREAVGNEAIGGTDLIHRMIGEDHHPAIETVDG